MKIKVGLNTTRIGMAFSLEGDLRYINVFTK